MNKNFFEWIKVNIGSCLSWAITFGWLIFIYFKIHNGALPKDLNEFGDFIAGAFAPLAFFWLVRGFYQQGKGLEQNSEALKLQALELEKTTQALELQVQEMKLALVQQTALAETTKQDLELSKSAFEHQIKTQYISVQPFLNIFVHSKQGNQEHNILALKISNSRSICREVEISRKSENNGYLRYDYFDHLVGDATIKVNMKELIIERSRLNFNGEEMNFRILENFKVIYLDSLDERQEAIFQLVVRRSDENNNLEFYIQKPSTRNISPLGVNI